MNFPKAGRVKLSSSAYRVFKATILELDGWKCLLCGRTNQLSLEHVIPRSKQRLDTQDNCFTCCIPCNQAVKDKRLKYEWEPATRTVRKR